MIQGTPEWLEFRRSRIGASDAPVIMGESPWKTPYGLWLNKLGLEPDQVQTHRMKRGIEMEEAARQAFSALIGYKMSPAVKTDPELEWMIASLDGISEDGKIVVEIKCPGREDHATALSGKIPKKYTAQLQHQMYVCGLESMYYYSFDGTDGIALDVMVDRTYMKELFDKEAQFYYCMTNLIAPSLSERDYNHREDFPWRLAASKYFHAKTLIEDAEIRLEIAKKDLINLSEDKNCKGYGVSVKKIVRKGAIDYCKIPEIQNVDLEIYRKDTTAFWKLTCDRDAEF
jgi:putative phage-type endonuclease